MLQIQFTFELFASRLPAMQCFHTVPCLLWFTSSNILAAVKAEGTLTKHPQIAFLPQTLFKQINFASASFSGKEQQTHSTNIFWSIVFQTIRPRPDNAKDHLRY